MKFGHIFFVALCVVGAAGVGWAFCQPWVSGAASLVKPVAESTQQIQEAEPTGIVKGTVLVTQKVVDAVTQTVTRMKLEQTLRGYEVAFARGQPLRKYRPVIFLLFLIPVIPVIGVIMGVKGMKRAAYDVIWFLFIAGISGFFVWYVLQLEQNRLFVSVKVCYGLVLTVGFYVGLSMLVCVKMFVPRQVLAARRFKGSKRRSRR